MARSRDTLKTMRAKCKCGQQLELNERHFGKQIECPGCKKRIKVPAKKASAVPAKSVAKSTASKAASSHSATQVRTTGAALIAQGVQADPPCPSCSEPFAESGMVCKSCSYSRRLKKRIKKKPSRFEKKVAEVKEAKKKKPKKLKKEREPLLVGDGSWGLDWGQVGAGGLMVLGGGAWLILGLLGGRIYFYPVILICIGIVTAGKGLLGAE